MSKGKVLPIVLLVIVAALALAAIVADQKYAVIMSSPRVSHETLVKPQTRAILCVNPQLAKDVLAKLTQVPAWVLPLALPNEAAFLIDVDYILSDMKLTAFINDKRLGPVIRDRVNGLQIPPPFNQWLKDAMQVKERGVLVKEGGTRVNRNLLNMIREQWEQVDGVQPPKIEGGHMLELAIQNEDGAGVAIAARIVSALKHVDVTEFMDQSLLGMIAAMDALHVAADATPENELKVRLTLDCNPKDPANIGVIQMLMEVGVGQLQPEMQKRNTTIEGKTEIKGNSVEGNYVIKNFDGLLAQMG